MNQAQTQEIKTETENLMTVSAVLDQASSLETSTTAQAMEPTDQAQLLEQQIPIHIAHHEATDLPEAKFIELSTQQLAQHLPPHSTYGNTVQAALPTTVTYREFKFQ